MGQSSDQIRHEIDQKREDAAAKIDQLQSQVQDTTEQVRTQVQDSAAQVQETVQHVREQVQGTVEDSVNTAKEAIENIDLHKHVQERPLIAVGAAFFGGILLGKLTSGSGSHSNHQQHSGTPNYGSSSNGMMNDGLRSALHKSGLEDTISNAAAALLGNVGEQLRATLDRSFPGFTDKLQTVQQSDGSVIDRAKAAAQPESPTH